MKIRNKISLTFIVVYIVIITIISFFIQIINNRIIINQVSNHLMSNAELIAHHIESLLEEQEDKIEIAATHSDLTNDELKEISNINEEFYEVFVLNSEGIIISSSNELHIGLDRSFNDYFINARNSTYIKNVYYSETTKKNSITVSAPQGLNNVLVARIDIEVINKIASEKIGMGETGEVLLAKRNENGDAEFFTDRRFGDNQNALPVISKNDLNIPMTQALLKEEGMFLDSIDYRNEKVFAATQYIEKMDWGLVAKIDKNEVMRPSNEMLYYFILISFLSLLFYLLISIWLSKKITKPLEELHHGTEIIEKGNLDHKVGINTNDEIGQLSRSFDKMTQSIKKSRADISKKVKEQTQEIVDKQENLENQQKATLNILDDVEIEKDKTLKEKDKIAAILHSIGDAVFVVNDNLEITMFNQIAADISGFSIEEAIGKKYNEVLNFVFEKDKTVNDVFIKDAIRTGDIKEMANHTLLIRKDGTEIPVADSAAPLKNKDNEIIGCVVVFRDVSKEREVDKMKTEFVSVASHQLRTPLTAIKLFVEMLQNEDIGKLNPKQKEYLEDTYKSTNRMVSLVNDLLNVSRLETGRLAIKPELIKLDDFIQDIINEINVFAKEHKCEIIFKKGKEKLSETLIDPTLMRQVVSNLITNAIRYSLGKKSQIIVKLIKEDKNYIFSVKDNGIGIPKEGQLRIFQKFFRADNAIKRETEGSGLGLYVSKMIIESSGGKIWFESEENKGTTFYFSIPTKGMKEIKGEKGIAI